MEKQRHDDHDEAATTGRRRSMAHADVDLNLKMGEGLSSTQLNVRMTETRIGRNLKIGQPSGSEIGDRAASFESRGPGNRKRSAEDGGSTVDGPLLRVQQADSVEGMIIDHYGDEVDDSKEYSPGACKRYHGSDAFESLHLSYKRDSSDAVPSQPVGFDLEAYVNRSDRFDLVNDHSFAFPFTRDSTHVSSVIAMDTVSHSSSDDSLASVVNHPVNVDDPNFPSSNFMNLDLETSEFNYRNHAQQSACFQPAAARVEGEAGVSSTNHGEEVVNTETGTSHAKDGFSFGISVGMGTKHQKKK